MKTTLDMVTEFHRAFEIDQPTKPECPASSSSVLAELSELARMLKRVARYAHGGATIYDRHPALLRVQLMTEELGEVVEAMAKEDLGSILHETADLRYVVDGTVLTYGLGAVYEDAVALIHSANMSKLEDGRPVKDAAGRVTKGRFFRKADVSTLLENLK